MFMKRKKILSWSLAMTISLFLCGGGIAYAKVTGPCADCHTMHNSQHNVAIDSSGPNPYLTKGGCVGCHTGTNIGGSTPFVFSTIPPTYGGNTLAGGNFYWATQNGATGHNVKGIPNMSVDSLSAAPGNRVSCGIEDNCHTSLFTTTSVDTGCEGCHLEPKHHAPQQAVGTPALAVNGYFRFLSGHQDALGAGVEGIEDDDWEYERAAENHNEYLGVSVTKTGTTTLTNKNMSAFCCGCHGDFHVQQDASDNWIRHPSDAVIPDTIGSEYAYAFLADNSGTGIYDPDVPVARPNFTGFSGPKSTVAIGTDLVMCLSCHRAHGSPYNDMLRWDYSGMVVGNGSVTGCFKCHSEKN